MFGISLRDRFAPLRSAALSRGLTLALTCAAAAAACTPPAKPPVTSTKPVASAPATATAPPSASPLPPGKMLDVTPTKYGPQLAALGIDVKHLPKLEDLSAEKLRLVMDFIAEATGADCLDCHESEDSFASSTPRKAVAGHMWEDWTRGYTLADGSPVFCDSCHHESLAILDRKKPEAIGHWMKKNFTQKLVQPNGKPPTCATCHGTPFDGHVLERWRKEG
jgi:hypothetical protein